VRVEVGEQICFPTATEDLRAQVNRAVDVDDETAVLVLSTETGQRRLVTEKGPFFPGAYDEILEVRKRIRVEPHEVAIVQDENGVYTFHDGSATNGTAFFLPPHSELVTMYWGSGTSPDDLANNIVRNHKCVAFKVPVTKIDLRSQYAFFEYTVRTSDNVELVLEGTIFWQVTDVPKMIQTTGDPKGDVWYHCRSALIAAVSRVTLESFMAEFSEIVAAAAGTDNDFYADRGVKVHSLEVIRYECMDARTSSVLQEIIQETTNRINRLQQQHSENEVAKERVAGEIEVERQRQALIQAQADNDRIRALIDGEAEGLRMAKSTDTFFSVLKEAMPDEDMRLELLKFLEAQAAATKRAEHVAGGSAHLFLAPTDMDLKLNVKA